MIPCPACHSTDSSAIATYEQWSGSVRRKRDMRLGPLERLEKVEPKLFETLRRCDRCGTCFIDHMPSAELLERFYQNYTGNALYSKKAKRKLARSKHRIRRLQRLIPGGKFLDVGCNLGFAVEAARQCGFEATGIELSKQAVEKAQEQFPGCRFFATSSMEFAKRGETFDLIYSSEVIEHVPDPVAFVESLRALLKPGGALFLTTPDAGHFLKPRKLEEWKEVRPPAHIIWYDRRALDALLKRHGFTDTSCWPSLKPTLKMVAR